MVCPYCGNRVRWWRHYYQELKQHEITVLCKHCDHYVTITEEDAEREAELKKLPKRERYRAEGLCIICGSRKPEKGNSCCKVCISYVVKSQAKEKEGYFGDLSKREYEHRIYYGLCLMCGEPSERSAKYCKKCKEKMRKEKEDERI